MVRPLSVLAAICALLLSATACGSASNPGASSTTQTTAAASRSQQIVTTGVELASLDYNAVLTVSDRSTVPYVAEMSFLGHDCTEQPSRVGDHIEYAHRYLAAHGLAMTRLQILHQFARLVIGTYSGRTQCGQLMAGLLATATNKG